MEKYKATIILIAANILVFALQVIEADSITLSSPASQFVILKMGANLNPLTLGGEYWRLLTSMFMHADPFHLLTNMFGLFVVGRMIESAVGSLRFTLVYFICGIVAALSSLYFNVFVLSVGASGAIFGVFGYALTAEIIAAGGEREKLTSILIYFVLFLVVTALITSLFAVDLAGHIGGMITGVAVALFHFKLKILSGFIPLTIILLLLPISMAVLPKDQLRYYRLFNELIKIERDEDHFLSNINGNEILRDSLLTIQDRWDSLAQKTKSMNFVNDEIAVDTLAFKRVLAVHKSQTRYRCKVLEQSYIYLDSIEVGNAQFDSLPRFKFYPVYDQPPTTPEPPKETDEPKPPRFHQARVFYDSLWKEIEDPTTYVYYRTGMRDSLDRWQGPVRDYYRGGKLQMKGAYKDNLRDGVFIYYSQHNTYQSAGRYVRENAVGKWEEFHWNGKLAEETYYDGRGFTRNVWDSLGRQQVVNGIGKRTKWHPNGLVAEEGSFVNGRRDGMWKGFHEDGSPYYEEMYRDNELIRGAAITKDGRRFVYDQLSLYPVPEGGMPAFRRYEILNKKKEFIWSGTVKVVFDVASDGTMSDFTILESSCADCNAEAIRLVKEGPRWRPGVMHGHQKISGRGYVEIPF